MSNYPRVKIDTNPSIRGQASLYQRGQRLLVRFPDLVGLGRDKYWSTGLPVTTEGLNRGKQLLNVINSDIIFNNFDPTLERYQPFHKRKKYQEEVERLIGSGTPLIELWEMYCDFKEPGCKESTMSFLRETIGNTIRRTEVNNIHDAQVVYQRLKEVTKPYLMGRTLNNLNTLYKWCLTKKIITAEVNPYPQIIEEFKLEQEPKEHPKPRPLTDKEVDKLYSKMKVKYHNLIKFSLLCGCRPSEAIGIEWQDVNLELGVMTLGRSVRIKGKNVYKSKSSKTGRRREFPLNDSLKNHLMQLPRDYDLVNPNPDTKGLPFAYNAYYHAWCKAMQDGSTPYNCRDTFISRQIELGVPPAVVAQWVDNSVTIIEKHYLKLGQRLKPID